MGPVPDHGVAIRQLFWRALWGACASWCAVDACICKAPARGAVRRSTRALVRGGRI